MSSAEMLRKTDKFTGQRSAESIKIHNYQGQSRLMRTAAWLLGTAIFLSSKERTNFEIVIAVSLCILSAAVTWVKHAPGVDARQKEIDSGSS